MGSWGPLPWDSDNGQEFADGLVEGMIRPIQVAMELPLTTDSQLRRVVAACDMFVRVAPYWSSDSFETDLDRATKAMTRVIELLESEGSEQNAYNRHLLQALVFYREIDPLCVAGVPLAPLDLELE